MKYQSRITYMKTIACILVLVYHVLTTVQKWSEIPEVENSLVTILVQWLDCVHVPAFFFCSGYLYFGKALSTVRECIQFVVKKIINLGIPYISFSFLYVFLSGVGKNWGGAQGIYNNAP